MRKVIFFLTLLSLFTSSYTHSQWVQQTIPVSKPITGIKFIDSFKGWACTDYGTLHDTCYILHTTNGGINWVVQFRKYASSLQCLAMIDANTGYSGGYNFDTGSVPLVLKTTNGGVNWFNLYANVSSGVTDIFFINAESGYTSSQLFINLYTTTNGGQNWTLRTTGINASVYRLFFLNYNTGYAGAASNLFKTTNAGLSWFQLSPFSSTDVNAIYFFNEQTGFLGLNNHQIAKSTNGGYNWNIQHVFDPRPEVISDIYFVNATTGYAGTGWLQRILKTTNAGLNWGYQIVPAGSIRISVLDELNVWSAQFGISRTTNGGGNIVYEGITQISSNIPEDYRLYQNYPNPFNPVTNIKYQIVKSGYVILRIFDVPGREIKTLVNQKQSAGTYTVDFDAGVLPSGVYFYQLKINNDQLTEYYIQTKKMILIKLQKVCHGISNKTSPSQQSLFED